MPDIPRITDAEWEVMNVVWSEPPKSALEVAGELAPDTRWNIRTIKTLLTRLVKKGALGYEVDGQRYLYRPLVSRDDCVREEGRSLLKRVKNAPLSPLLAHFMKESRLSSHEIDTLRDLLDQKERDQNNGADPSSASASDRADRGGKQ